MLTIRKAQDRGHFDHGWLDTYHSFSFAGYYDPAHMGFGPLRVINDDTIAPGAGFPTHGHRNMEIITYVLDGALEHRDSTGRSEILRPGEVQRISAGAGITHSEYNPSISEPVHLLQIWLLPSESGGAPAYEQRTYPETSRCGRLCPVASPTGADGAIPIKQEATVYVSVLDSNDRVSHDLGPNRKAWIQVARGSIHVNGERLSAGDGAAIEGATRVDLAAAGEHSDVILFDLP